VLFNKRLETLTEAQQVREIRNSFRRNMTRHTEHITPEQQNAWFHRYINTSETMFLYYDTHQCLVGYGYITQRNNQYWGTLAVKAEFQGKGYGKFIYQDMIDKYGEIWIEIYADNVESLHAAVKAGFQHVTLSGNCIILKGNKNGYDPTF